MQENEVSQSNFCRKFAEYIRSACKLQEVKIGKMFNLLYYQNVQKHRNTFQCNKVS